MDGFGALFIIELDIPYEVFINIFLLPGKVKDAVEHRAEVVHRGAGHGCGAVGNVLYVLEFDAVDFLCMDGMAAFKCGIVGT